MILEKCLIKSVCRERERERERGREREREFFESVCKIDSESE